MVVSWIVEMGDDFEPEFNNLHVEVRNEILAHARLLKQFGPLLGVLALTPWTSRATRI